ncbi:TetR family transcriptional regulator [Actinoplanes ianthinogenes]|uniref:TetR family transcriptional regulator n=1 Tax=Actinoplanes ianthinogenes TaxID=122358 RepID=A0ABM7M4K9_9ACTN|nr:TetR family transcriptional regulator [Actinoplanes ianthinogenes]BCJ46575.1 TetR family transcriptional regulator [Actinoplanes ianthinogenes]GGR17223.1 TetR family transcriptional regulator [Actinoplanes ianthinogenes]
MGRVSQAQARENRERIVATAAGLFRERGIAGVSVADISAAAGLTHGGFYKQFESKDALVTEAIGYAFAEQATRLTETGARDGRRALLDAYLSIGHRDEPAAGCPTAGFAGDVARAAGGEPARDAYAEGVEAYARMLGTTGEPDLAAVSTMVGALLLARATAGTALSERILTAARDSLAERETLLE